MLQEINIVNFFNSLADRRWSTSDIKDYIVIFATEYCHPFIFVQETAETVFTVKLFNAITDEEAVEFNTDKVVVSDSGETGYKIVKFIGDTFVAEEGYYYYTIDFDTTTYYSEVFAWKTDLTDFIKFEIESANITMSGVHNLPYLDLNLVFYLQYNGYSIVPVINEDGVEKGYGDIPVFNTLAINNETSINGTENIFRYLSALRVFLKNGSIKITRSGVERNVYDVSTEVESDDSFGDTIIINFSYKETDFISARNEI